MKKERSIINKKTIYDISVLLNNTALVHSIADKACLVNIKSHEIIGEFDNYYTTYYSDKLFYFQEKSVDNTIENNYKKENTYDTYDKYVNIYDALEEKFIIKNYKYISGRYDYAVFQDPVTKKFHLFDMRTARYENSIFYKEFDSIKTILDTDCGTYTVVEQNGQKGIYNKKEGRITIPIEFDDIKRINNKEIIVFEKKEESYFTYHNLGDNGMSKSPLFKSIECDCNYNEILYCKTDLTKKHDESITIYNTDNIDKKLLCKFPMFDELKCLEINSGGLYVFLVKQNGKYGLYGFNENRREYDDLKVPPYPYIEIVPPIYDKIEKKGNNYFLHKDDKVGLFTRYYDGYYSCYNLKNCQLDAKYDDIKNIGNTYVLFSKGECDIVTLNKLDTPYVSNCEFVEKHLDDIIYKIDDKYGIDTITENGIKIINGLDKITYKSSFNNINLYIVKKNGKNTILYNGQELFKPTYEDIDIFGVNEDEFRKADFFYFKLKEVQNILAKFTNKGNKYKLAKFAKKNNRSDPEPLIYDEEYEDIQFYKNFMLLNNGQKAILYDYNENILKVFPSEIKIQHLKLMKKNKEIDVYDINGIYYFYKGGKLEQAFIEDYDLYVTTYITDTDSFEVSTYNKIEHDEFCSTIDSQSDVDAEKNLLEIANDLKSITAKYPTLVLKKVKTQPH